MQPFVAYGVPCLVVLPLLFFLRMPLPYVGLIIAFAAFSAFIVFQLDRGIARGSVTAANVVRRFIHFWIAMTLLFLSWLAIKVIVATPNPWTMLLSLLISGTVSVYFYAIVASGLTSLIATRGHRLFPLMCDHRIPESYKFLLGSAWPLFRASPRPRAVSPHEAATESIRGMGRKTFYRVLQLPLAVGGGPRVYFALGVAALALLCEGAAFWCYGEYPRSQWLPVHQHLHQGIEFTLSPGHIAIRGAGTLALVQGLFFAARKLRGVARRISLMSATQLRELDRRRPVLFLRPFRDDHVSFHATRIPWYIRLIDPLRVAGSLEELVITYLSAWGPVVAIGNPDDSLPPLGAARQYVSGEEWTDVVRSLMDESSIIVIGLGDTDSVLREIKEIKARNHLDKTWFLFPPGKGDNTEFIYGIRKAFGIHADLCQAVRGRWRRVLIAMNIGRDGQVETVIGSRATETEYELAIRAQCRHHMGHSLAR